MTTVNVGAAVAALMEARRSRVWLSALPEGARPATSEDAYTIQDAVAQELGPIAGWKVGSATLQSEPFRAAIHEATFFDNAKRLPASILHLIGVEAELVYRFARDLPPRAEPYSREEVLAAVGAMHPAIEIVDTRFTSLKVVDPLSQRADQQNHGALAIGPALRDWTHIEPPGQAVRLTLNGVLAHEGVGGNSAVDPVRLLVWMANAGARSLGGLRAGHAVTTGSCSGTIFVEPGTRAVAEFPGLGTIDIEIA